MHRQWRIRIQGEELRLLRYAFAPPAEAARRIPPPVLSRMLAAWLGTVDMAKRRQFLRELLDASGRPAPHVVRTDLRRLWGQVEQRIAAGDLIGVPVPRPTGYGLATAEPAPSEAPPAPPPAGTEQLTWIEIELLDTDGEPVPGEVYSLTLPDGTVRSGRLDTHGLARVTGIPAGTCTVTFPGMDGREWRPA